MKNSFAVILGLLHNITSHHVNLAAFQSNLEKVHSELRVIKLQFLCRVSIRSEVLQLYMQKLPHSLS